MGKVKKVAKWAVPAFVDVDSQVEESLKDKTVQKALERYDGNIENFKNGLEDILNMKIKKIQGLEIQLRLLILQIKL